MTKPRTCAQKGCKAPSNFIKDNGFCHAHGPGAKERLQLMGMRGGETMRRRWAGGALLPNELPPLVDHESAKKWLEILGRAVASKKLPAQEGRTVIVAVEAWLRAHVGEAEMKLFEDLREDVERLKEGMRVA